MYKKVSVALLLLLLVLPIAFGTVEVVKTSPTYAKMNEQLNTSLRIGSNEWVNVLDINELIPNNWTVLEWAIDNYNKYDVSYESTNNYNYEGKNWTLNHWRLNKKFIGTATITYTVTPENAGTYESRTTWTYEGGFGNYAAYSSIIPSGTPIPIAEETRTKTEIVGITVDLTILTVVIIIGGFAIAAILLIFFSSKGVLRIIEKIKESKPAEFISSEPAQVAVEDLRAFIKLGLQRGYTLREMVNALKGANVDATEFNNIAKEEMIIELDKKASEKDNKMPDSFANKLKTILEALKFGKR